VSKDNGSEEKIKVHSLVVQGSSETGELLLAQSMNWGTPVTWSSWGSCATQQRPTGMKILKQTKWVPGGILNRQR